MKRIFKPINGEGERGMMARGGFLLIFVQFFLSALTGAALVGSEVADRFAISADKNITESAHLGLTNHHATFGTPYETVGEIDGFWAPPFVASDFSVRTTLDATPVAVSDYTWRPTRFYAFGERNGWRLESESLLAAGARTGMLILRLKNDSETKRSALVSVVVAAPTLDESAVWEFPVEMSKTAASPRLDGELLRFDQGEMSLCVAGADTERSVKAGAGRLDRSITLDAGAAQTVVITFALGKSDDAANGAIRAAADSLAAYTQSLAVHNAELAALYDRLPKLESDNPLLVRFYDRSILHFFMNRWDVPEFLLHPYYSTGSVRGGCLCSYLWNFGEPWEILPLFDPDAERAAIRHYLSIDLSRHFAFRPTSGLPCGPWYMINQEKIIGLFYYYVRITGDLAFLDERVGGRPIRDHLVEQAFLLDDPEKPVALIDYGDSNSHLELRRDPNLYNHIMPDLNGRRCANYLKAAELLEAAGTPDTRLRQRAADLKALLKKELWNGQTRWFDCPDARGNRRTRWTIQMYKLFDSGALDAEQEAGLLSHWNESKFLGEYGVHSLAKDDTWYDENDVDNGGPGACTDFGPQIAERFFRAGYAEQGTDILRRMLWLGDAMPYWGDSVRADRPDYRHDTPLQCMFDSTALAQSIIFGLFGIDRSFDGTVTVSPHKPDFAQTVTLQGVRIGPELFDVTVDDRGMEIVCRGEKYRDALGQKAVIRNGVVTFEPGK